MVDFDVLSNAVTSDPDVATRLLEHFYPEGKVSGDWFILGNLHGKNGDSTQIKIPECCGKDQNPADGGSVAGPISIIRKAKGVSQQQAAKILQEWLVSEGIPFEGEEEEGSTDNVTQEFPWSQHVRALTACNKLELSTFRGYSAALVERIIAHEALAKIDGKWCFPLKNKADTIIAIDQLVAHPELRARDKKQKWTALPAISRKLNWFSLGCELESAKWVFITESRWDTLSLLEIFTDDELKDICLLGATGASQSEIPTLPTTVEIVWLAIHNDRAGWKWAKQIAFQIGPPATLKMIVPPDGAKDLNDLLKAGKLQRSLIDNAKRYSIQGDRLETEERTKYYPHGGPIDAAPAVREAYKILQYCGQAYNVNNILKWLIVNRDPRDLNSDTFNLLFQNFAIVIHVHEGAKGFIYRRDKLRGDQISLILNSGDHNGLPRVSSVLRYPQLMQINGELRVPGTGYVTDDLKRAFFILNNFSTSLPEMDFKTALDTLLSHISEFDFKTENDRSRCLALMLGPAMRTAGYLGRAYPVGYIQGDEVGCGKTTLMHFILAIYGETSAEIGTRDDHGTGSFYNNWSAAVAQMKQFTTLDNHRGPLDCPQWEAAITRGEATIRPSCAPETVVDTSNMIFMMTTNGSVPTPDFMDRSLKISLGFKPNWSMNETERYALWVSEQLKLLKSVWAIIEQWVKDKNPGVKSRVHRFTNWTEPMEGIITKTCGRPSLLEGVTTDAELTTDPNVSWARDIALALRRKGKTGEVYFAKDLEDLCREQKNLRPPGAYMGADSLALKKAIGAAIKAVGEHKLARDGQLNMGNFTIIAEKEDLQRKGGKKDLRWSLKFKF